MSDIDDMTLAEAFEIINSGPPHYACPDGWMDCNAARKIAEHYHATEPLSLDVLRRELTAAEKETERQQPSPADGSPEYLWWIGDLTYDRWIEWGESCGDAFARMRGTPPIGDVGTLRRLLSVIRENAAGGEGE